MKKSYVLRLLAATAILASVDVSALTLNGKNYKAVSSKTTVCPDKSKAMTYQNGKYCQYRTANLAWSAPARRVNGSALPVGEISGYEVYWTRTKDKTSGVIKVKGGGSLKTSLEVFVPDTYNFAMSAVDTKGLKSPLSTMVSASLK